MRRTTEYVDREFSWRRWLDSAPAEVVWRAVEQLRSQGICPWTVYRELRESSSSETDAQAAERAKSALQKTLLRRIRSCQPPTMPQRIRDKLGRWEFLGHPRRTVEEFQVYIGVLRSLVPPRVLAAVISTAWNRWATERRWQRRWATSNRCVFGCKPEAEDSIEHYRHCSVVKEAHWKFLKIQPPLRESLLEIWVLGRSQGSRSDLVRGALGAYATYRAFNQQKFGTAVPRQELLQLFGQFLKEGALRHLGAEAALRSAWCGGIGFA